MHAVSLRGILLFGVLWASRALAGDVTFALTDARGQPVPDAVVSLVPLDGKPTLAPLPDPIDVRQEKQEFIPYVTAVVSGTRIRLPNEDSVQHHVYSQSKAKSFDFPLYKPKSAQTVLFDQPGVVVMGCNIHDWMIAYVVVLETPWFAQTEAPGKVTVTGVPPGRYRAEVWHPQLAIVVTREVVVTAAASAQDFKLTLRPDRRIRRPADAGGGSYK